MTTDYQLADRANLHLLKLADYECTDAEDLANLNDDIGALRTISDLAEKGGLTAAGRVLAERVVAGAEAWLAAKTGDGVERRL